MNTPGIYQRLVDLLLIMGYGLATWVVIIALIVNWNNICWTVRLALGAW